MHEHRFLQPPLNSPPNVSAANAIRRWTTTPIVQQRMRAQERRSHWPSPPAVSANGAVSLTRCTPITSASQPCRSTDDERPRDGVECGPAGDRRPLRRVDRQRQPTFERDAPSVPPEMPLSRRLNARHRSRLSPRVRTTSRRSSARHACATAPTLRLLRHRRCRTAEPSNRQMRAGARMCGAAKPTVTPDGCATAPARRPHLALSADPLAPRRRSQGQTASPRRRPLNRPARHDGDFDDDDVDGGEAVSLGLTSRVVARRAIRPAGAARVLHLGGQQHAWLDCHRFRDDLVACVMQSVDVTRFTCGLPSGSTRAARPHVVQHEQAGAEDVERICVVRVAAQGITRQRRRVAPAFLRNRTPLNPRSGPADAGH